MNLANAWDALRGAPLAEPVPAPCLRKCCSKAGMERLERVRQSAPVGWQKIKDGKPLTWRYEGTGNRRLDAVVLMLIQQSVDEWVKASGGKLDVRRVSRGGDCVIRWDDVDGRNGTLAYVLQPGTGWPRGGEMGAGDQLNPLIGDMTIDRAERWTVRSFRSTITHEFGHVLGLGHLERQQRALMYPYANDVQTVTQMDLALASMTYPRLFAARRVIS